MSLSDFLTRLKELEAKATGGKWSTVSSLPNYAVASETSDVVTASGREYRIHRIDKKHGTSKENADLIAESRNALPTLLKIIEIQNAAMEAFRAEWCSDCNAQSRAFDVLDKVEELVNGK